MGAEPLRIEMHFEMYSWVLICHQFFNECRVQGPQVLRRVCHNATSTLLLEKGDIAFSKGDAPSDPKMYFVCRGMLEYSTSCETVSVMERQWVAEAVLWTNWVHRGTLTATDAVKIAMIDADHFQTVVAKLKRIGDFDPK